MQRVRIELTMQFDPDDPSEVSMVAERVAAGMTASELTALWDLVDQAIRHPAHLSRVAEETARRRDSLGLLESLE